MKASSPFHPGSVLVAAAVAVALAVAARQVAGVRLLAEVVLDATTDGSSPQDFSFLLRSLQDLARPLLFATVILGQIIAYAASWRLTSVLQREDGLPLRQAAAALVSFAAIAVFTLLLGLVFDAGLGSQTTWPEYLLVVAGCAAVFAIAAAAVEAWTAGAGREPKDARRRLLLGKGSAVAAGAIAVYVLGAQVLQTRKGGTEQGAHPGEPTPEVTPNDIFYVVSKNLIDPPKVDAGSWRLRIGGDVASPAELTLEEIRAMPAVEQYATFQCISNEVGGYLAGTALWKGVPLRDLLALVRPLGSARHLWFESTDDYTEDLPLAFAMLDGVMLAYDMNGVPLPHDHGFPLRLVAPGKYGMKQPKWIHSISLRPEAEDGYWARRGWDTEAGVQTSGRIDVPKQRALIEARSVLVQGIAFAGRRGIQRVEVSTDGGVTWGEATLKQPLSPYAWVLWQYAWQDVPSSGEHRILARATDGEGATQTSVKASPFPRGATGYPEIEVRSES